MRILGLLLLSTALAVCSCEGAEIMNGMVYAGWTTGGYSSPFSDISVKELAQTHNSWVSIVWTWYQDTMNSTEIAPETNISPSEADIAHFVQTAKSLGLKVAFKPHVDLSNDPAHWRGEIGTYFDQDQWNTWFASYQSFIYYVASVAAKLDADLLIVGTELSVTESQVDLWRATIQGIRKIFGGPLVYGANWSPFNVTWWDALDFIGIDAYFPLSQDVNPPVKTLVSGWDGPMAIVSKVAKQYNKTVIFTEIGYQSRANAATAPYGVNGPLNLLAQSNCYQAFFMAVYSQPWFQGVFWWAWGTDPNEGGQCDSEYTPHNKPAEAILQKYYSSNFASYSRPLVSPYVIYKNGQLNSDWQNYSYSGTVEFQSTTTVYPGESYSISASLNAWGAVSLHISSEFNVDPYTSLTFLIAGSSSVSNSVFVSLYDSSDQFFYALNLADFYSNCTVGVGWQSVTVPIANLFPPSQVSRVNFLNYQSANGLFYLDEIYFV
eukprot:Phypoly_transcript_07677.p1 GENE.Phypoly_transcript_07677~~Phypoly_transcript_07677.p1  ORF type:complete len:491 (+),score=53.79 Phypoly_transcript_07677:108-1580(+)